jgi:hypothetical protein
MRTILKYTLQVLAGIGLWAMFYVWMWRHLAGYAYYTPLGVDVTNSTVFLSIHLGPVSAIVFVLAQITSYLGMRSVVRQVGRPEKIEQ